MDNQHIIVLDIGTTTAKSIVFSTRGESIAIESIPFSFLDRPQGYYEQDPNEVYRAVEEATYLAVKKASKKVQNFNPVVVSIVCQGGSLVPCDQEGNSIYPMITWMDNRSAEVTKKLIESGDGAKVYEKTGFLPSAGLPLSMVIWLRENEPEVFSQTKKWLVLNDFVVNKLTGNFVTNYSSAALTQFLNVDTKEWDDELIHLSGIKKEHLSRLDEAESSVGGLLEEPAINMGLPVGIPIVNGLHDRTAEAVGLGLYNEGDSWIGTGTAWVVCSIINSENRKGNLTSNFHTMTEKRIASTLIGGLGTSVEWWISELISKNGGTREETLSKLDGLVEQSSVGANGLLFKAFTSTGNTGSFINETPEHTDADKTRAIFESIAFDFKKEYEEFAKHTNIIGSLTLVGGATRSQTWPKIIAEVLGVEIKVSVYDHTPALGAAILAGKYLKIAEDFKEIYEIFKTEKVNLVPEEKNIEIYKQIYKAR